MTKVKTEKPAVVEGDRDIAVNGVFGNRVMVGMSKTINLGNYASIKVEFAECRVVQDGESFNKVREEVKANAWVEIADMVAIIEEASKQ